MKNYRYKACSSNWFLAMCSLAGICTFTGCGSQLEFGAIQRDWSTTFRQLGVVPVFPPREDFMVGDVYVTTTNPDDLTAHELFLTDWDHLSDLEKQRRLQVGMNPRLARLDVNSLIDDQYRNTISAPPTTPEFNKIFGDSNPAIDNAKKNVEKKTEALKEANEPVETAKQAEDAANAALLTAQSNSTVKAAELTRLTADLTAAKAAAPEGEISAAQSQINTLRTNLKDAKKNVDDAQDALNETQPGTPEHESAQRDLDAAISALETQRKIIEWWEDKLRDHLDAAEKISDLTAGVRDAQEEVNEATKQVALRQSELAAAQAEHAKMRAKHTEAIDKAKADLASAKSVLTAIKGAGVDLIIDQPNAGQQSVYSGSQLHSRTIDRTNRLRLVGFPDFSAVTYSGADAAALIPVEAFQLGVNASDARISSVSVKVPSAESYSLSIDRLMGAITHCPNGEGERLLRDDLFQAAVFQTGARPLNQPRKKSKKSRKLDTQSEPLVEDDVFYMRVISEVFYARAIDIGVFTAQSGGFRATATTPTIPGVGDSASDASTASTSAPSFSGVPAGTASGPGSTLPAATLASLGTTVDSPGGSVQLVSYSERSVGLRRLFHRPVAVGFRGLTLRIKVCRKGDIVYGRIEGVYPSASLQPEMLPGRTQN